MSIYFIFIRYYVVWGVFIYICLVNFYNEVGVSSILYSKNGNLNWLLSDYFRII